MSNTTNIASIYAQIVEVKKKQLELGFLPASHKPKNYATQVRELRAHLANLQRDIVIARKGGEVAVREVPAIKDTKKRGKK